MGLGAGRVGPDVEQRGRALARPSRPLGATMLPAALSTPPRPWLQDRAGHRPNTFCLHLPPTLPLRCLTSRKWHGHAIATQEENGLLQECYKENVAIPMIKNHQESPFCAIIGVPHSKIRADRCTQQLQRNFTRLLLPTTIKL